MQAYCDRKLFITALALGLDVEGVAERPGVLDRPEAAGELGEVLRVLKLASL